MTTVCDNCKYSGEAGSEIATLRRDLEQARADLVAKDETFARAYAAWRQDAARIEGLEAERDHYRVGYTRMREALDVTRQNLSSLRAAHVGAGRAEGGRGEMSDLVESLRRSFKSAKYRYECAERAYRKAELIWHAAHRAMVDAEIMLTKAEVREAYAPPPSPEAPKP